MKVNEARFVKSAMDPKDYPRDRRPEVAFVGRSNVGKSSLLNVLLNKKGLAKTSGTPGKTQTLNFFDVNGKIYFVDLPGYGFAKVPLSVKEHWNRVMGDYLRERDMLRMVVLLVDARHKPTELDQQMLTMLEEAEVPTLITATKFDKLKQTERRKNLKRIRETFGLDEDAALVAFSAVTGEGKDELWGIVDDVVAEGDRRTGEA